VHRSALAHCTLFYVQGECKVKDGEMRTCSMHGSCRNL